MAQIKTEHKTGSDCSGSSGGSNRILTLTNTNLTQQNGFLVYVSGLALALTDEYTVSHLSASTTVTFLKPLWDDMTILVNYFEGIAAPTISGNTDFDLGPLTDLGVTVTRTPVTVTEDNISGQKTYSDGSTNEVTAIFCNPDQNFALDKAGLTEICDGRIYVTATETLNKYDKILHEGKTYRVDKIDVRKFNGDDMFKRALLFFAE